MIAVSLAILYMNCYKKMGDMYDLLEKTLFKEEGKEWACITIFKVLAEVAYDSTIVIHKKARNSYQKYLRTAIL